MSKGIHSVAIVGAGGMGGLFGAILSKGGLKVTLIDNNREHIEAIRAQGLRISGFGGERTHMLPIEHDVTMVKQADIVLVQCKGTATREAACSMKHLADGGSIFISFQNGLGNEDVLTEILGSQNVFGGLTSMAGACIGPGHCKDFGSAPCIIGEWAGGTTPRAEAIAAAFTIAGLETSASADIKVDIWKKLVGNMAMSAAAGVTNLTSAEVLKIEPLRNVCFAALDEALSIAHSQNIGLDRSEVLKGLEIMTATGGSGENKPSLCLDILAHRPSEVEFIYGTALKFADAAGLAVPTLRSFYALVKGIETHYVGSTDKTIKA